LRQGCLIALAVAPGIAVDVACSNPPSQPTQVFVGPQALCPAPASLLSPSGQPTTVSYGSATTTGGTPPTTISCSPASGSVFPIGATTVTCTATDHVNRTNSCTFAVTVTGPPRLSATRFIAFGDSMTFGEDGRDSASSFGIPLIVRPLVQFGLLDTYPGALQADLAGRYTAQSPQVKNGGLPDEAVTGPATFPRFVGFTSSGAYDVVLLMEGANDLGSNDPRTIAAGLGRMIDDALSRSMKVFLATIPPENPSGIRGRAAAFVEPFNVQVAGLASSKGVPLVDVYQAFGGNLTLIGFDGLHPTADGYHLIAATFFARIRQTLELPAATSSSPSRVLPTHAPLRRR
jgi:lysophospholipase L1-like esterase